MRDSVGMLSEGSDVIPGACVLNESGTGFMVKSNIFGWTEETFTQETINGEQFVIHIGPDGLLNRNADQKSDDSIVLNEKFGPLGVPRNSMHTIFVKDNPVQPSRPKPRTVTNGKVDGQIDGTDVANTAVSLSDQGVFTVTSTNPAAVPAQRAKDIENALNALTNAVGIFAAHELGHALGLIAKTDPQIAVVAVEDKGTFLSPLAGIAESHNRTALGQLMDKGEDIRWRTIFTTGKRMPIGDANMRYLKDCYPEAP